MRSILDLAFPASLTASLAIPLGGCDLFAAENSGFGVDPNSETEESAEVTAARRVGCLNIHACVIEQCGPQPQPEPQSLGNDDALTSDQRPRAPDPDCVESCRLGLCEWLESVGVACPSAELQRAVNEALWCLESGDAWACDPNPNRCDPPTDYGYDYGC
jgi:hypothetical protein